MSAYLDQELGVTELMSIDKHLESCPACRSEHADQGDLSASIKAGASYFEAPARFAARLRTHLPQEQSAASAPLRRHWRKHFNWLGAGAALVSVLAVAWGLGLHFMQPSAQDLLAEEVVTAHVRSLQVDHLSDVASTDQHTVKPWFNGKLDFSPPVIDLATQGFPLIGGRLEYLEGHAAAALIYRVRQHPINLLVWSGTEDEALSAVQTRHGYHLLHWTKQGMNFWVISDSAASDVERFAHALLAASTEESR
jgi:anti-sigma factor RsiW